MILLWNQLCIEPCSCKVILGLIKDLWLHDISRLLSYSLTNVLVILPYTRHIACIARNDAALTSSWCLGSHIIVGRAIEVFVGPFRECALK